MLYLEDYLEMIEHLPQELKDRFTEIRELDLQVQNATDKLDDRVKLFFAIAKRQKTPEREAEYEAIRTEYYKVMEDADEKVHQANQMYELVEKYARKLDQELYKFKMELEADNAGITEVLEKRSLEMDHPAHHPHSHSHHSHHSTERGDYIYHHHSQKENRYLGIKQEKKERKNSLERGLGAAGAVSAYTLGAMGAGGNAIAAAASQAIAATQQMQQGRRTASLKASYDAVNLGIHPSEFSVGRELLANNSELHAAAQQALAATGCGGAEQKRNKRKSHHTPGGVQELFPTAQDELLEESLVLETAGAGGVEGTEGWTAFVDPSEPRYCLCNEVSYGDMVACDNPDCTIEWFHYACVGITVSPKGKWYCPPCSATMKRRGRR